MNQDVCKNCDSNTIYRLTDCHYLGNIGHKSFIRESKLICSLINLLNWNDLLYLYIIMSEN